MAKLVWDADETRFFETGVSQCVLFPKGGAGVAWNGITAVDEAPSGAEETVLWADNKKYGSLTSTETFGATISAYTWPDEFAECDGTAEIVDGVFAGQQPRKPFDLAYRTEVGNDVDPSAGFKLHLLYGCKAKPAQKTFNSINESPEAMTFSWELSTQPVDIAGHKPSASITIDSRKIASTAILDALWDKLYGTATSEPAMPTPAEVITLLGG